jgi:hypothetical protein
MRKLPDDFYPLTIWSSLMSLDTLADAFHEELRDVLSAERQLIKATQNDQTRIV